MPSYVGDPRPSMLQSLPPWVPRPLGVPEDVGSTEVIFLSSKWGGSRRVVRVTERTGQKSLWEGHQSIVKTTSQIWISYPTDLFRSVHEWVYSAYIWLDKVLLSLKFEERSSIRYSVRKSLLFNVPSPTLPGKRRPDQDICSFSVISSWNARVPAGYSGLRLQQLKRPPVAQVCGWVMFWRASWMDQ